MSEIIIKPNKQRRRYSIEINENCNIVVRTPWQVSQSKIDRLLKEHDDWIQQQLSRQMRQESKLQDWLDPNLVYYRGKQYQLEQTDINQIQFKSDRIVLPKKMSKTKFLTKHAALYLPERCLDIAEQMGLITGEIKIRRMKSCWGTCHRNRNITLNLALIQAPDVVSDYVMIHECAHLVHFDHSKQFWELVDQYTSYKKKSKQWLKDHQAVLMKLNQLS